MEILALQARGFVLIAMHSQKQNLTNHQENEGPTNPLGKQAEKSPLTREKRTDKTVAEVLMATEIGWKTCADTSGFGQSYRNPISDRLAIGDGHTVVKQEAQGDALTFTFENGTSVCLKGFWTVNASDGRIGYMTRAEQPDFSGGAVMNSPNDTWLQLVLRPGRRTEESAVPPARENPMRDISNGHSLEASMALETFATFAQLTRELRRFPFDGATIIEHRRDGDHVVGRVEYGGASGNGSIDIGWSSSDGGNRTTVFDPASWKGRVRENVVFFGRVAQDASDADVPWKESDLYAVVASRR